MSIGFGSKQSGSPTGALIIGTIFYTAAEYWPEFTGTNPDAGDHFYLGFFQFLGAMAVLSGLAGYYARWKKNEKIKEAEAISNTFGTAAFATSDECLAAGLFDPNGLYLGLMEGQPLFYSGKAHLLTVAPARQGKGISTVIPNLLHFQGSMFVTDPKGELAAVTAKHRKEHFGQDVVVLNPWRLHGLPQHQYNPLQPLLDAANDPLLVRGIFDEAKSLALQLLPEPEDARNRYFREGSRTILRGLMLHLATFARQENCTLTEMWLTLSSMRRMEGVLQEMCESEALYGAVAALGSDLLQQATDNPEQFADFRQGAVQAVDIFDPVGWLSDCVSDSDVSFTDLKNKNTTIYLVIPQDKIATHGAWLGLVTQQAVKDVARSKGSNEVLFLLDEFANMGRLAGLAESLTALPGLGVRVWAIVQELSELIRIYGPHTAATVMSQAEVKQFFAVQDKNLASMLSQLMGQRTVKTRSYGLGPDTRADVSLNLGETGQPLMSPAEVRLMAPDEQLLFVNQVSPIRANRMPFWFVDPWMHWVEENPVEGAYPMTLPELTMKYQARN